MKKILLICLFVACLVSGGFIVWGAGGDFFVIPVRQAAVPEGTIIMWSGEIDPYGHPIINGKSDTRWHICDGNEGTPDLKGRFVRGAEPFPGGWTIGAAGGAAEVILTTANLPAHTHGVDLTSSLGGQHIHSHQALTERHVRIALGVEDVVVSLNNICIKVLGKRYCVTPGSLTARVLTDLEDAHYDGYSLRQTHMSGSHSHTVSGLTTFDDTIEPGAIPNMPPYYDLVFLMYIGG